MTTGVAREAPLGRGAVPPLPLRSHARPPHRRRSGRRAPPDPCAAVPRRPRRSLGIHYDPDAFGEEVLRRVNARRRVFLSSTRHEGRYVLRICVVSFRTHQDRVDERAPLRPLRQWRVP